MLLGRRLILAIVLAAAAGLLWAGLAAAKKSDIVTPAVGAKSHRSFKVIRPDLSVVRVRLDGQCRVTVLMRNSGKLPLTKGRHQAVILRLKQGDQHRDFPLAKIDYRRKLTKPGGEFTFVVPLAGLFKQPSKARIIAQLDVGSKLAEAKEDNNSGSVRLKKRCRIHLAPPVTARRSRMPIKVKRVYVRKGTVRLVLIKTKGVKLTPAMGSLRLAVRLPKTGDSWTLRRVDKKRKLAQGRELHFDTGLKAAKASRALVTMRWNGRLVRLDAPLTLAAVQVRPVRSPSASGVRVTPPTATGPITLKSMQSGGLGVYAPKLGDVLIRGGNIEVKYRNDSGRTLQDVRFFLIKPGSAREKYRIRRSPIPPYDPDGDHAGQTSFRAPIPSEATPGNSWIVYAEDFGDTPGGPYYATSDAFTIQDRDTPPSASDNHYQLMVVSPMPRAIVRRNAVRVSWGFPPSTSSTTTFLPSRGHITVEESGGGSYTRTIPFDTSQHDVTVQLGETWVGRSVRIRVQVGPERMPAGGIYFAEGITGPVLITTSPRDFSISSPGAGARLQRGGWYHLQWGYTYPVLGVPPRWKIELLRGSSVVRRWESESPETNGTVLSFTKTVLWPEDLDTSREYTLRVSSLNSTGDHTPVSEEVTGLRFAPVSYMVTLPNVPPGGKLYRGKSYQVYWRQLGPGGGEVDVREIYPARSSVVARGVPVRNHSYPWRPPILPAVNLPCVTVRIGLTNPGMLGAAGNSYEFQICNPRIVLEPLSYSLNPDIGTRYLAANSNIELRWRCPGEDMYWSTPPSGSSGYVIKIMQGGRQVAEIGRIESSTPSLKRFAWAVDVERVPLRVGQSYVFRVELEGYGRYIYAETNPIEYIGAVD